MYEFGLENTNTVKEISARIDKTEKVINKDPDTLPILLEYKQLPGETLEHLKDLYLITQSYEFNPDIPDPERERPVLLDYIKGAVVRGVAEHYKVPVGKPRESYSKKVLGEDPSKFDPVENFNRKRTLIESAEEAKQKMSISERDKGLPIADNYLCALKYIGKRLGLTDKEEDEVCAQFILDCSEKEIARLVALLNIHADAIGLMASDNDFVNKELRPDPAECIVAGLAALAVQAEIKMLLTHLKLAKLIFDKEDKLMLSKREKAHIKVKNTKSSVTFASVMTGIPPAVSLADQNPDFVQGDPIIHIKPEKIVHPPDFKYQKWLSTNELMGQTS